MTNFEKCDQVSFIFLSLSIFLGIMAFVPGGLISNPLLKGYLVVICSLISFVAWLLGRLIEGSFHIPRTPVLFATGCFIGVLLLSSLFSQTPYLAFFGEGFEQGTFAVLASMLLGLFLASMLFVTRRRIFNFLKIFFILYTILALFQVVHVFFPGITSLGVFKKSVDNPVGLLSDFALLSGAVLIGSVMMLEFVKQKRNAKIFFVATGILSLFFVVLANVFVAWLLVGFSSIIILIYMLVMNRFLEKRRFPFLAFGITLIALFFILANALFGGVLAQALKSLYADVHPSASATLHTSIASLKHNPIFGAGPNRFLREWLLYRPLNVNTNVLWDVPFVSGSSLLGTIAVLGGTLGILAVLFFLITFFIEAVRKLFISSNNLNENPTIFGLFVITLYFLLGIIFFSPGIAITVCSLSFIGIFFGILRGERRINVKEIHFLKEPRAGFFSILGIVALLLVSASAAYAATQRFAGVVYFERGVMAAKAGNFSQADIRVSQAIELSELPLFERTRVVLAQQAVTEMFSSPGNASSDAIKTPLQNAISIGNKAARRAIELDPGDPSNYLAFGDFLRFLARFKLEGVLETGVDAYGKAIELAPNYPKSYLSMAMLYFDSGDITNARAYVQKALDQKKNYTEAYFLLAQIEMSGGNREAAIQKIQSASLLDQNNPDIYFELGMLYYGSQEYKKSIDAFAMTVSLNNQYYNAWYYLALSHQAVGNTKEAMEILTVLHERFPDNQDVNNALLGKVIQPVTQGAKTEAVPKPEKAKKLPIPTSQTNH